jgi:outer membrane protein OmpA-like peptidoglycan-associated protein
LIKILFLAQSFIPLFLIFKQIKFMLSTKHHVLCALIGLATISLYSCKSKKMVVKTPEPVVRQEPQVAAKPAPEPQKEEPKAAVVEKPDYNFGKILFEFNSSVLKTASFEILDKAATEMKKDPAAKFSINGHSSAEGTPEHNMSLSVDRANAVKSYLVNAGFSADNFTVQGLGEKEPAASNATDAGKALNRRVEIKVNP